VNFDFYKLFNLKFKQKEDIPEDWNMIVDQIDDFIEEFLLSFDIDMDFLYTTNVGILNVNSQNQSNILWDISYWAIYIKYLEFVFWMENEQNKDKANKNRLVFLSTIFQYISYKFYNEEELSYCFALLYDANKCFIHHEVSDEVIEEYTEYIQEQLAVVKLFCAFHEAYHLKKIPPVGDYTKYHDRIMFNVITMINSDEFESYYCYDMRLVDDVRKRVNSMNEQDQLLDELYADAAALDLIDVVFNYMELFQPKWSLDKFSQIVKEVIENFYSFNTLTYDLYTIWEISLRLIKGQATEEVYKQEIHKQDIEDVIRGQVFPAILWMQIDGLLRERGNTPPIQKIRHVNVRKEMIDIFDNAYNDKLKKAVDAAIKQGFNNSKLTISEARDILIEWDKLDNLQNASIDDLFLTGGIKNEIDFIMFVRGY
jgi:hypothetical protein